MKDTLIPARSYLHYILLPLILASLFVFGLHLSTGMFWEEYEPFVNQFFTGRYIERPYNEWLTDNHFLLHPIYAQIEGFFPGIQIYSWINASLAIIINALFLSILFKVLRTRGKGLLWMCTGGILVLVILYDSILFVSNVRWSILLCGGAYLSIMVFPRHYVLSLILLAVSFFVRVEMPLLLSSVALTAAIFCLKSKLRLRLLIPALATFVAYGIYIQSLKTDPYRWEVYKFERAYNEKDLLAEEMLDDALNTASGSGRHKALAMRYFVRDSLIIRPEDFGKITPQKTFFVKDLSLVPLVRKISTHTKHLLIQMRSYSAFHYFFLIFIVLVGIMVSLSKLEKAQMRIWIILGASLFVPLGLNVLTILPERVFLPYFSVVIFTGLLYMLSTVNNLRVWFLAIILFLVVAGGLRNYGHTQNVRNHFLKYKSDYKAFGQKMNQINEARQNVYFANGSDLPMFPHKLFAKEPTFQVQFVDAFMFSYYHSFEARALQLYGLDYQSLRRRIEVVESQNALLVASDAYMEFLKEYLKSFHKVTLDYEPIDIFISDYEEKGYRLRIVK
jgi:hypothetical protein